MVLASTAVLIGVAVLAVGRQPQQHQALGTAKVAAAAQSSAADLLARVPLAFVENRGQWATPARFVGHCGGTSAHLAVEAMTYQAVNAADGAVGTAKRGVNVRLGFEGRSPAVRMQGLGLRAGRLNVCRGADPSAWHTDIATYERVTYAGLWPGVDLEVRFQDARFEYDVLLAPGADLDAVVLSVEGTSGPMRLGQDGSLLIETALGELRQPKPATFEQRSTGERVAVDCRYRLLPGGRFGFEVPALDPSSSLLIDPGLVWSTYLGGSSQEDALAVALATGAVYVTGKTRSTNFPLTPGVFATGISGLDDDVFVTKLAADGSSLLFSTHFGGTGNDVGTAIAVDATGAATVAGSTSSTAFPTTAGAFDTTHNGGDDGFVARLTTGGGLVYSTYLGGTSADIAQGVVVDAAGAATVVGWTSSVNYPTTAGSVQPTYPGVGQYNAFVTRLALAGNALTWSTFLGPIAQARGAVLDSSGEVTVTGETGSALYPVTAGAYDISYNGNHDAFVTRIAANGAALVYSTFVGGTQGDEAYAVGVDSTGATVLAGITFSASFPVTAGAADTSYGSNVDAFVAKLTPGGAGLAWSTFLGGSIEDRAFGLALDATGVATVVGRTNSSDFPTTADAFDPTLNSTTNGSGYDAFVTQLGASNGSLVYSTYVGGTNTDEAVAVAMNATGAATVVGVTASPDFPTTAGAFLTTNTLFNRQAIITRLQLAVIDTVPPLVTITGPADGAVFGTTSVTLSAHVVDTSTTTVVSTPAGISASLPAGGGSVSGVVALALEGMNELAVSATDAASNVGGTSIHVIRDTTVPTVTVMAPVEGAILAESPASLVIQVADATGTTVVFGSNAVVLPSDGGQATGDVALVSGANAITVTATDAAGNQTAVVRNVVLDLTAPVVTIDTPADGASFGPGEQQLAVAATVDDLTTTTVTSTPPGVAGALPPGGGVVTGTMALVEGTNTISVAATDGSSRIGSASITVLLDTTVPHVTVDSPADAATLRGAVEFDASAADVAPGTGIARVDLLVDNVLAASLTAPPFHVTVDTSLIADGPHSFTAVAVDGKDNQASATVSVLVDNTVPAITIATPASAAIVAGTIPFTVVANDAGSGLAAVTMLAGGNAPTIDGSAVYANPVAADTRAGQVDTTTLLDGALLLSARAVDAAGNEATVAITVTVDNTAPQKTIISPTDGSVVSGVVPIVVGANDPNLASLEILVDNVSIGTSASSPFTIPFDTTQRVEGPMSITVIATDLASNASTCSITVTVDNQTMVEITPGNLHIPRKATGGHATVQAHLEGPNVAMLLPPQAHGVELRVPGGSPVPVLPDQVSVHDNDNDLIPEVKFAFDRQAVIASIRAGIAANVIVLQPNHTDVLLTVVANGVAIASDTVRIKL